MSPVYPRSAAVQAALVAVLVLGVTMLLVASGRSGDSASDPDVVPVQDLGDGLSSIASDEFFATVTRAQRAAGTWTVVSVSEIDGSPTAPSVQEVDVSGEEPAIRTRFDSGMGTIEAIYLGEDFFVRGFTGTETPWWKVTGDDAAARLVASLAPYADPTEFLDSVRESTHFEVIGVEEIEAGVGGNGSEMLTTVHYRTRIDAPGSEAPVTMDMWVDAEDRPVRVETVTEADGRRFSTRLFYVLYGEPVTIEAPSADQVTTETPAELLSGPSGGGPGQG